MLAEWMASKIGLEAEPTELGILVVDSETYVNNRLLLLEEQVLVSIYHLSQASPQPLTNRPDNL